MPIALVEEGNDLLYRYLSREQFKKQAGFYHPDPMFDEFTYGEGGGFSVYLWNNIGVGSRIFFHTTTAEPGTLRQCTMSRTSR